MLHRILSGRLLIIRTEERPDAALVNICAVHQQESNHVRILVDDRLMQW